MKKPEKLTGAPLSLDGAQAFSLPNGRVVLRDSHGLQVVGAALAVAESQGSTENRGQVQILAPHPGAAVSRLRSVLADHGVQEGPSTTRIVVAEDTALEDLPWSGDDDATTIFLTLDADGVRVGPTLAPKPHGAPCFLCAQAACFRGLALPRSVLAQAIGEMRGVSPAPTAAELGYRAVAREVLHLAAGKAPAFTSRIAHFRENGSVFMLPVESTPDCPVCGGVTPLPRVAADMLEILESRPPAGERPENDIVRSVVILGGGTAGYLAALMLRKIQGLDVRVIEAPDVPIIGVGEATTPLLPQLLHADLEIETTPFFQEVRPTLKLGIRFDWGGTPFNYPFGPLHVADALVHDGDLAAISLRSLLMNAGRVPVLEGDLPKSRDLPPLRLGTEVAYHLDNQRFAAFLRRLAEKRGVQRIAAHIRDVKRNGEIVNALVARDGRRFSADLFIDASGFRSLLMGETLQSPFVSFSKSLFTDRALIGLSKGTAPAPYTTARAMDAGWCWSTPQANEDHVGYVFASAFLDDTAAETEMRRLFPTLGDVRPVGFKSGRREDFWCGNVVALGNAYGFVEPLESTALHMLGRQLGLLVQSFPLRLHERSRAPILNRRVRDMWDYLAWFLALHFKFNKNGKTPFWRACRDEADVERHGELLALFNERGPLSYDRASRYHDYPDPLWGPEGIDTILLGQGVPAPLPRPRISAPLWQHRQRLAQNVVQASLTHSEFLEKLIPAFGEAAFGEAVALPFRQRGAAFPI